ncbi:hypothetical protein N9B60_01600 [Mariniblastus sp.]|jgi:hypothetical protein|nr:hypothetical protein [Mariniblastus sp.]MDA7909311.1 hypothetical protein [bacterium]MDA7924067.1 hypothetical protein [Mariniblastus sp.]MDB4473014.1 hypothetical protein [bacterium]
MEVKSRSNSGIISCLVILLLFGGYFWLNRGYGEVSPDTYQFSKALYSACLKKSDEHLAKIEELLDESDESSLPSNERIWLTQITQLAQSGDWESAARKAKRMMEDQVKY